MPFRIKKSAIGRRTDNAHNDWAWLIRANFQNRINDLDLFNMAQYQLKNTTPSHTDITRLRKGQVGGQVCILI
ncbi:unnamed protein product [Adineta steineri]|uniref:Uncharacterized protein n=1 Tax=Adineta steineri TaxID=433720 RepID=A0A819J2D5_9BILA|nr:unnamed protein product [Adineta steineri]